MSALQLARFQQRGEEGLVRRLHVGLLGLDGTVLHAGHEAVVHRHHAVGHAALDDGADVGDLAAADGVGQGLVGEEDLVDGAAALGHALAQQLGDDAGQAAGEHHAHLVLLVGGEGVDDAVDRLGRVVGVQRAEDEHAHRGAAEGELDGLELAHFTEEQDVGVVPHRALERGGERPGVLADLAVDDDGLLHRVDELDRVLDRDDVPAEVRVDVVDHRRERGRLAAAGGAGDDDEALVEVAELLQRLGELELVEGEDLGRDLPEHGGLAPVVVEVVAAEAGETRDLVGEVEILALEDNTKIINIRKKMGVE